MTLNKDMLESPTRTFTSYVRNFSTSHPQKCSSFCDHLPFPKWLWTWRTMTLWAVPTKPTSLCVWTLATNHLECASAHLPLPPLRRL